MKIISDVENLKTLNLNAIRISQTEIEFRLDGRVIHTWTEPCLTKDDDVWYSFEINGAMYDVNYFGGEYCDDDKFRVSFYGLYEDDQTPDNQPYTGTRHETWHTIEVVTLIDQVIEEMKKDFESGDLTCIEELLKFVPTENLKGYLPHLY